jgi:hypothetical protein
MTKNFFTKLIYNFEDFDAILTFVNLQAFSFFFFVIKNFFGKESQS